jgi:hypothetical protein
MCQALTTQEKISAIPLGQFLRTLLVSEGSTLVVSFKALDNYTNFKFKCRTLHKPYDIFNSFWRKMAFKKHLEPLKDKLGPKTI